MNVCIYLFFLMLGFELQLLVKNARFLSLSLYLFLVLLHNQSNYLEKNEANNNDDDARLHIAKIK